MGIPWSCARSSVSSCQGSDRGRSRLSSTPCGQRARMARRAAGPSAAWSTSCPCSRSMPPTMSTTRGSRSANRIRGAGGRLLHAWTIAPVRGLTSSAGQAACTRARRRFRMGPLGARNPCGDPCPAVAAYLPAQQPVTIAARCGPPTWSRHLPQTAAHTMCPAHRHPRVGSDRGRRLTGGGEGARHGW